MKAKLIYLVLALAFLLRFISLTSYPVGFNADEASWGYDAYSILKTGKDQWGEPMPLVFKSFGDYKSPFYGYLTVPFVKLFGLNKFAVRLPNAIVGTFAVLVVYLLVTEIAKRSKLEFRNYKLEIIASFLLAISPWHIMMSRGAFETNLVTLLIPLGVYLFLTNKHILSALVFGLAMFGYHSAKIISPLVFIGLFILFRKEFNWKKAVISWGVFAVFIYGIFYTLSLGGGARISERSITQGALEEGAKKKIELIANGANPVIARLMHNKYQVTAQRFVNNYLQYFSPRFLFTKGAGESYYGMRPGIGVLNAIEGILILGVIILLFNGKYRGTIISLLAWLLIAPVPAALSTGVGYSGHRALGMIPVLQILAAFGVIGWARVFKKLNIKYFVVFSAALVLAGLVQMRTFVMKYFSFPENSSASQMLYQSFEALSWANENKGEKKVMVTRSVSEPQIFAAFASKLSPEEFQNSTKSWGFDESNLAWVDQLPEYSLGNWVFKSIDWAKDGRNKNALIVSRPAELPKDVVPTYVFYYPDGEPNIYIIDTEKL